MQKFTPDMQDRYAAYRSSGLKRSKIRKIMQETSGLKVSPNATIVMSGMCKLFVG